jgi:flagellar hook protein FlgE
MSLYSAMQAAVSGLNAQSQALAIISDNISNSSTTGYKSTTASFSSFVTQTSSSAQYDAGGVSVTGSQNITQQGLIESTTSSTDLAIDGEGFFVVTDANGDYFYSRDGEFEVDDEGYLVTADGYYLMGYGLDENGNIIGGNTNDLSSLSRINVNEVTGTAAATENVELTAILPSDAEVGDTFTTSVEVYDSLGTAQNLELTWEKTATNEWNLMVGDPTSPNDSAVTTGTTTGGPYTVTFNGDGTLDSITPDVEITITGWTSGANDSTISFDLGTTGSTDGLSQYATDGDGDPAVELRAIDQDGARYGELTGVEIGEDGAITVSFDNDETLAIYEIPIATFPNANGLQAMTGNVYAATMQSGTYLLSEAGSGGAGTIVASALEASTVDIADEFTRMIVAQQAYSAASRVITTSNEMMDELTNMVR